MPKLSKKPGFWSGAVRGAIARQLRNRVSQLNLGVDAKVISRNPVSGLVSGMHPCQKARSLIK
ncbi:MAG: hypothetical protein EBE86_021145 [Hormoscilla sp. GUM202]|nr:hypothetical protein [Hormoscilla sp. GUM202]